MIEIKKYNELLYSVERKFTDETRHQTALRYIKEREQESLSSCPDCAADVKINGNNLK